MITRRATLAALGLSFCAPGLLRASTPRQITWDDLIPPGVPYSEIIGQGEVDEATDFWRPIYDANATKFNTELDGAHVRLPGYILPLDFSGTGITEFLLVPYVGACLHVPPPPANQLVLSVTEKPWPSDSLWQAVWVTGQLRIALQSTELAEVGYRLAADRIEAFEW